MKDKKILLDYLKRYSFIILGCVLYSLGVSLFLDANDIAAGGVTGIAIIISRLAEMAGLKGWDTGIIIIVINVPLFILGAVFFGKKFIISTIFATVLSSALIELWTYTIVKSWNLTDNILIAGVAGGVLYGGGIGLIFRMGSTTGGTDIVVKILRKKFRHLKTGVISMLIDVVIIGVSGIIFKDFELTFYTFVSVSVFTLVFDFVLYGGNSAKLLYIVTTEENARIICDGILNELDISATLLEGTGAYTKEGKTVIMCAIKNINYPRLRDIIKTADPNAFTIVSSAKEIYGEGYKENNGEEL